MQESASLSPWQTIGGTWVDRLALGYSRTLVVVVIGLGLVLLTIAHLLLAMYSLMAPKEVMYGEAIIFEQAARILHGDALYQPFQNPPYTVTAYTPVYYWLAAGLQAVFGATFLPGRLLSFAAGLASTGLVCYLAYNRTGNRWCSGFAGLLFVGLGFAGDTPWFALYKEDVLGVAFSLGAVSVLARGTTYRRILIASILAALAVLTKQTLIAATAAGFGSLWFRDHRRAGALLISAAGICALTAMALQATQGAFLANTIFANVNPSSREALVSNLKYLAHYQAALIAIAAVTAGLDLKKNGFRNGDVLLWYWAASALPLLGLIKVGSNHNYWIEFAAATAVLVSEAASWAIRVRSVASWQLFSAGVMSLLLVTQISYVGLKDFGRLGFARSDSRVALANATEDAAGFTQLLDRVRAERGDVLAEPLDVVALAGRPVLLEPIVFTIFAANGQWDSTPLIRRICGGDVRLLVLGYPLEQAEGDSLPGGQVWPSAVILALRHTMQFESKIGGRYVYTPSVLSTRPDSLMSESDRGQGPLCE